MNKKELIIDFIQYAKKAHIFPILEQNIEPLVDDYLSQPNDGNPIVSGSLPLEAQEFLDAIVHWEDKEFKDGTGGHKVVNMRPIIIATRICKKLVGNDR